MSSSTDASSAVRRYLGLMLAVLVLTVAAGLYAFSGLPRPWARATQEAHDTVAFQRFAFLARVIQSVGHEGTTAQLKKALEAEGVVVSMENGLFEGEELIILEYPRVCDEVVLMGQKRDQNGMVWAITRRGDLLKMNP